MTLVGADICFWMITFTVVISAYIAAFARHIVHAAFGLFFTLAGMAGFYVLLGSGFLAITQVIIYVGGILVLLMFGILLTNKPVEQPDNSITGNFLLPAIAGTVLWWILSFVAVLAPWKQSPSLAEPQGSVRALGNALVTDYLAAFEVAGMLLLLGLIGAAYLVRRQEVPGGKSQPEVKTHEH